MSYLGNTPTTQNFIAGTDTFSGTGSQTVYTLTRAVNSVNDILVVVNNVDQQPTAYTVSGSTLTFTAAPFSGTNNIYVRYLTTTLQSIAPSAGTVGTTQLSATGTPSSTTFLSGNNTWAVPPGTSGVADTQTFNSSGTWTKPASGSFVRVQMWGGGGGGCRNAANGAGSGGGGGYYEFTVPIASMGATSTVTVGAAGVGRTASSGNGTNGGNSGVVIASGSTVYVSGGALGNITGTGGNGGYGGIAYTTAPVADPISGVGQGSGTCQPVGNGLSYTGGGGGSVYGTAGGKGGWGGGGGSVSAVAGGTSIFGGAGGNASAAGTQPGGGGGSSNTANVNGTDGGAGRVIITTY